MAGGPWGYLVFLVRQEGFFTSFCRRQKPPSSAMTRGSWDAQVMLGVVQDFVLQVLGVALLTHWL